MTQDRRTFLFYTTPTRPRERHFFGLADTMPLAQEIEKRLQREEQVRALFPGHPTPLLGATVARILKGDKRYQAIAEVRALRDGASKDTIARVLYERTERLKPLIEREHQKQAAMDRAFAQELVQAEVKAELAKRLPAGKVKVAFAVWSATNELPAEWIERSALESLGISPTSLDQDWTAYGSQLSSPVKLTRPTMYLKSYVVGYVLNRWTPRGKRPPKRRT